MSRAAWARSLAVAVPAAVLLAACARVPVIHLEAQPSGPATGNATDAPTDGTPSPTPTETETTEGPREPTDTDRARFVSSYAPEGAVGIQHVAEDVDGDDRRELVFAYSHDGQIAHIDIAWWTGTAYEVMFAADGGEGTSIDRLRVSDVNADGMIEVVTFQSGSGGEASASLWRVLGEGRVEPLVADGGCHDGSHTYGAVGARLIDRDGDGADEIEATCDDSPLPQSAWSSDTYVWRDNAYRHAPNEVF